MVRNLVALLALSLSASCASWKTEANSRPAPAAARPSLPESCGHASENVCGRLSHAVGCVDLADGYECVCAAGFAWNGAMCASTFQSASRALNATCYREEAGRTCHCNEGYIYVPALNHCQRVS